MKTIITATLCAAILCSGCATAGGGTRIASPSAARVDPALFASYVTHLPIGGRVRVALVDGHKITGTLMKADATGIVVQPKTRIPEPPLSLAADRVAAVELETSNTNVGKTVAIGVVSGAGGVIAGFLILAAIFAD
jgi:hypothetical protein